MPLRSLYDQKNDLFKQGAGLSVTPVIPGSQVYGPPAPASAYPGANSTSVSTGQPTFSPPPAKVLGATTTNPVQPNSPTSTGSGSYNSAPTSPVQNQQQDLLKTQQDYAAEQQRKLTEQQNQLTSEFQSGVKQAYNPIFNELDRQIGIEQSELTAARTPGIQANTREAQVQGQYDTDIGGLQAVKEQGLSSLAGLGESAQSNFEKAQSFLQTQAQGATDRTMERSRADLRDIDDTTRNLTTSGLRQLGAAGDSSAAVWVQQAAARENLKARGKALGLREDTLSGIEQTLSGNMFNAQQAFNTVIQGIEQKKADVQMVFTQQKAELDGWKTQQLNNLVNVAQERMAALNEKKAYASQEQQMAIAQFQAQTQQQLMQQLSALDQQVNQLDVSLQQWAMERAANLEDYKAQLASSASYSGTTNPEFQYKSEPVYDPITNEIIGQRQFAFNPATGALDPINGDEVYGAINASYDANRKKQEEIYTNPLLKLGAGLQSLIPGQ